MSGNIEAERVLGQILRPSDDPPPLLLLGAGASFRSGVPMAAESVKQIDSRPLSPEGTVSGIFDLPEKPRSQLCSLQHAQA